MFFKKGVIKNLENFITKNLCRSFFFNKVAGLLVGKLPPEDCHHQIAPRVRVRVRVRIRVEGNLPGELFLKRLQYLQENTCVGVCFYGNKVAGLQDFFIKTRLQHRCYLFLQNTGGDCFWICTLKVLVRTLQTSKMETKVRYLLL